MSEFQVRVKNVSLQADEKTLKDFFSFCGNITSMIIEPDPSCDGATNRALVTFDDLGAVQTSLLLTNAMIVDRPITVEVAGTEEEAKAVEEHVPAEGAPSKTSVMARMFAAGYVLGDDVKGKARSYDEKHNIALKLSVAKELAKVKLNEIDAALHISETATKVSTAAKEQFNKADEKLHIREKTTQAAAIVSGTAQTLGAAAMQNSVVAQGVGLLQQAQAAIGAKVGELKAQTKEAVAEKRQEKAAAGGNPYPAPKSAAPAEEAAPAPSAPSAADVEPTAQ